MGFQRDEILEELEEVTRVDRVHDATLAWASYRRAQVAETRRRWRQANKAKLAETRRRYYQANRERLIAAQTIRNRRRKAARLLREYREEQYGGGR